jgi:prevent-host-death family protein
MTEIGVRELKTRASEIVREVRDRRARYLITYRGRPVGLLIPLEEMGQEEMVAAGEQGEAVWQKLLRLGEEIGRGWQVPQTSAELISEMRR